MKRIFIFIMFIALGMGLYAEGDYYYYYRGGIIYLELLPTKKFVMLNSPEDTIAFKNHFTEDGITIQPFRVDLLVASNVSQYTCWTAVVGESLPDFTSHELVAYEAPYFSGGDYGDMGLSDIFYVKLHKAEDLAILENMAKDNNVTNLGNDELLPLSYLLSCTKESNGNAMQMANLFYESQLFASSQPDLIVYWNNEPTKIDSPFSGSAVFIYRESSTSKNITIETKNDLIDYVEVFDLTGKLLFASAYPHVRLINWDKANGQGIYIFKIKLQTGSIVCKKVSIK